MYLTDTIQVEVFFDQQGHAGIDRSLFREDQYAMSKAFVATNLGA